MRDASAASDSRVIREAASPDARPSTDGLVVLKTSSGLRFESPAEVEWLEADRNHVIFHIRGEAVRIRAKLGDLEAALDQSRFLRISRSSIVNLGHVRQALSLQNGHFVFEMRSGTKLPTNRSRARAIRGLAASVRRW
jgi:two-component system LytT family response regulator